jgi:hypothetical protein
MRNPLLPCVTAVLLLLVPAVGVAQQRQPLAIEQVQVGLGPTKQLNKFKAGFWTPVYVELRAWSQREIPKGGKLVVESVDSDDVRSRYTVLLPHMDMDERLTILTYTRPAGHGTGITVSAYLNDDRLVASKQEDFIAMEFGAQLYLTLGSRKSGVIMRALNPPPKVQRVQAGDEPIEVSEDSFHGEAGREATSVEEIQMVPNRWFGFDGVDVLLLTTGNREGFLTALLNEREGRKEALVEWVRRGGRLIISVGSNQDMVAKLEPLATMLPVALNGSALLTKLEAVETWVGDKKGSLINESSKVPIEVAKLERKPGREYHEIRGEKGLPLMIRGPFGLGSVTVLAFDVDRKPFLGWSGEREFWKKLITETAPHFDESNWKQGMGRGYQAMINMQQRENQDLATQLSANLEEFEDVPVISFGWVALFILLYILVVGPLDYFFLKKVVKRLELTWITFPTVVITISVAAYFTAYWLKGNDQKINKVDLVDIDLQTQQVTGNSWFTIFSPRIQHYTIGLEPAAPGWAPRPGPGRPAPSVMLTWMGRPETDAMNNRSQSQGLFRRAYDYAAEATGLNGVPIQVWSTKSFAATWHADLDPAEPVLDADIRLSRLGNGLLTGQITSKLPVKLEDVVLYYGGQKYGKWYEMDPLLPNVPQRVDAINGGTSLTTQAWVSKAPQAVAVGPNTRVWRSAQTTPPLIKRLMFYQPDAQGVHDNALGRLDEYWRLSNNFKEEVILYGRVVRQDGQAEDLTRDPASPTRLWLGALPEPGATRPTMTGTLSQDTYVRIVIPVKGND